MATLADVLRNYTPPTDSPMSDAVTDYAKNVIPNAQQNLQNQNNDIQNALKLTPNGIEVNDPQAMARFLNNMPNMMGATAYHGTPHTINGAFDISKVGTGEGAQAYGHGMYFAESPNVAQTYMPKFEEKQIENAIFSANGNINKAIEKAKLESMSLLQNKAPDSTKKEVYDLIDGLQKVKNGEPLVNGNLYKVDIPDEHIPNMLDWDKPLTEQTPEVRKSLESLGIKTDKQKLNEFDDALLAALTGDANTPLPKEPINSLGSSIYQTVLRGTPQAKSAKLHEAGIKGIRYLDQGSRDTGGTSNFVVFDPSTVKILEKNGQPVSRKDIITDQINNLKD